MRREGRLKNTFWGAELNKKRGTPIILLSVGTYGLWSICQSCCLSGFQSTFTYLHLFQLHYTDTHEDCTGSDTLKKCGRSKLRPDRKLLSLGWEPVVRSVAEAPRIGTHPGTVLSLKYYILYRYGLFYKIIHGSITHP